MSARSAPGRSLVCAADARIDNRDELARLLAPDRPLSTDADLLLAGYERWGQGLAARLEGDFAFVVWDEAARGLYAARDPFGVRPLFFARGPGTFFAASEIEQLLAREGADRRLNEQVILEYLLSDHRSARDTFFAGVQRVLPGHWLRISSQGLQGDRYWAPPFSTSAGWRGVEVVAEFQKRFRQAVLRRLPQDRPVVAQLSGGLDSSSIVCMAGDIYRRTQTVRPPLYLASMVYPGLDCDETSYIQEVWKRVPFSHYSWDGTAAGPLEREVTNWGHPWAGSDPATLEGDVRLAQQVGAEAILSGFGGDELLFERGVFRELAQRGWWWTLFRQMGQGAHYSTQSRWALLGEALRSAMPTTLRGLARRLRLAGKGAVPPPWLSGRLRQQWQADQGTAEPKLPSALEGATARQTWHWLTRPHFWWQVELQTLRAARQGLELRFPYLDRSLAEWILSISVEHRLPCGRMKRLLRRAMADLVPPRIAGRPRATTFNSVLPLLLERNRPLLEALLRDEGWRAEPFVDRHAIGQLLQTVERKPPGPATDECIVSLLDVVQLERWLRCLGDP